MLAYLLLIALTATGAVPRAAADPRPAARALEPLAYTLRIDAPGTHVAEVEATIPTDGRTTIELMMPVWSPGFYRIDDYAGKVRDLTARTADGAPLDVDKPRPNRWRIDLARAPNTARIIVRYQLACEGRSVTTNWVGDDYAVINGGPTFITLADRAPRPHVVSLVLPSAWTQSMTGLSPVKGAPHRYQAADFDQLVDSPILAGRLKVREFNVDGSRHSLVAAGDVGPWDPERAARDLAKMVKETSRFWRGLPFRSYAFLVVFRQGGGGLEHSNSTLVTASPTRSGTPQGYPSWLGLVSHEYFHAFNVKRLRPVELGPFDYEEGPRTTSLWFSEGVTSYYSGLMLRRAGLTTRAQWLGGLSSQIRQLQHAPGRLRQTLEQSSSEVWTNSMSGINPAQGSVSYYVKGEVVGFLLDARIRHATRGKKSLDEVMRLAMKRYGGARGFTSDELRATASEIAGVDLTPWFTRVLASTEELEYDEALNWFGLRFAPATEAAAAPSEAGHAWRLQPDSAATKGQSDHLRQWLGDK